MRIFLTESEVIDLVLNDMDLIPNLIYNEVLDMYEDIEEVSLRKNKSLPQPSDYTKIAPTLEEDLPC